MDQEQLAKFQLALPPFLTESDKSKLLAQLADFPSSSGFYGSVSDPEAVQGDAWRGFIAISAPSGEREQVVGLVVSNSCDIAAANDPDPDQNILFAPLLDLDAYDRMLQESGMSADLVKDRLARIRRQEIHRIFYLPDNGAFHGESLVLLDHIHAQRLSTRGTLERVFSLSTYGWYVLLMKLSVHFTRMTDAVRREALA